MKLSEDYAAAVVRAGRIGSFAPGNYLSKCIQCGITFDGDKRAINCLPCAVERLKTSAGGVGQAGAAGQGSDDNHEQASDAANGPTQIPPQGTTPVLSVEGEEGSGSSHGNSPLPPHDQAVVERGVIEQASEQVRKDASNRMQYTTTSDMAARLMCRVDLKALTMLLAHHDGLMRHHALGHGGA